MQIRKVEIQLVITLEKQYQSIWKTIIRNKIKIKINIIYYSLNQFLSDMVNTKRAETKKHHYVPQLHLRRFAIVKTSHGKKNYSLYYYDKKSDSQGESKCKEGSYGKLFPW